MIDRALRKFKILLLPFAFLTAFSYPISALPSVDNQTVEEELMPIFKVHTLAGFNTDGLDFCPVVVNDKLVFVSERDIDLINVGESGYKKQSYLTIQYSTITTSDDTTTYSVPKLFSSRISQLQHSGPISFGDRGDYAVFTRVHYFKNDSQRIYRPQLFSARLEKNKWKDIERLNINNSQYSFGHPALSSDGKKLYFVSNMEGGYGGKDIYVTENTEGTWTEPVNLGPKVNTAGNEAFPFLYKDSLFFFSSDGLPGFGALDLHYSLLVDGEISLVVHLDSSINSPADDFGFFLNPGQSTGYFSSNRDTEKKDDIYGFSMKWLKQSEMPKTVSGIFKYKTLNNKSVAGLKVYMVNDLGETVYTAITDEKGNFEFTNLPHDHNMVIRTDPGTGDLIMILLDEAGSIIAELAVNDKGEFLYKKLSYKDMGGLQFLYTTDSDGLIDHEATKTMSGKVDYKSLPYKTGEGMKIMLINEAGDIIYTAIVDEKGNFEFKNLPYDANYIVITEEYDPDLALLIFSDGEVVAELSSNPSGEFMYVKLPHSAATTLSLMHISDDDDVLFFRGYDSDEWIKGENGVKFASTDHSTIYVFETLGMKNMGSLLALGGSTSGFCPDTYDLSEEEVDDCIEMTIEELLGDFSEVSSSLKKASPRLNTGIETIYFDHNSSYFHLNDSLLLNKVFEILKSDESLRCEANGYTDASGKELYNDWMAERRGERIMFYLIYKGISEDRLSSNGWGTSEPLSTCTDCSEDELRLNRRAEIRIY